MITLSAPRLNPKYAAIDRELSALPPIVAEDKDDLNALAAVNRALGDVPKNGGQLSTEGAVHALVLLVRSPECERREVEIKELIEQLAKAIPEVSVPNTHRIAGAFRNAQDRGKHVKHLWAMYLKRPRSK